MFSNCLHYVSVLSSPTAMPDHVEHVDELIAEYEGREDELLSTLSAMQTNRAVLNPRSEMSDRAQEEEEEVDTDFRSIVVDLVAVGKRM